jgi:dual-specificity kinase
LPFGIEPHSQLASPLGLGWSYECDAFSLGCILVEFYTGVALYQTHDNLEHLAMMEMVMGPMSDRFARQGTTQKAEYFKGHNKLDWPPAKATRQSKKDVKATKALEVRLARIGIVRPYYNYDTQQIIVPIDNYNRAFLDLVRKLLGFDPADRIRVRDALKHPYFSTAPPNDYT